MDQPLAGRTAIVTGAAEGIGLGIATSLTRDGASVIITDVQDAKGEAAAQALGGRYVRCDVASEEDWAKLRRAVTKVDILVNNAGINPAAQDLCEMSLETWRSIHAVNLDGVFLGCRFAVKAMGDHGGSIVNIASAGALHPHVNYPAYSSSKAAVCTLTKSVALYCGRYNLPIRCNAVLPGAVETPMVRRLRGVQGDPEAARAAVLANYPIGFIGEPSDIGAVGAFLCSDAARYMTGAQVAVDGGFLI